MGHLVAFDRLAQLGTAEATAFGKTYGTTGEQGRHDGDVDAGIVRNLDQVTRAGGDLVLQAGHRAVLHGRRMIEQNSLGQAGGAAGVDDGKVVLREGGVGPGREGLTGTGQSCFIAATRRQHQ